MIQSLALGKTLFCSNLAECFFSFLQKQRFIREQTVDGRQLTLQVS